ncbi:broad specificity phosphatase PhoE [Salana multivorans]|uniref:Broad specificity phosphatase PhoE n=1 Tax=Salana multivorans TaxID=120377 RepID=A0A3N2DAC4_9MICO|nr:histidine phosphatase family protein [Salana multivorans]ROR96739.1 broad specificity phosphatase PhoE [Salana multivorans]
MQREIVMVRHGEAYNTAEPDGLREVRDHANPPLTPLGEAQAAAAARPVAELAPDAVVVSPFLRAAQTAFAHLGPSGSVGTVDVRMSEHFVFRPLADFAGLDLEDYRARFGDRLLVGSDLATAARFPRFPEDEASLAARATSLVTEWLARDDWRRLALYGHWATVVATARVLDPGLDFEPGHCSITRVVEDAPGRWRVVQLAGREHLAGL